MPDLVRHGGSGDGLTQGMAQTVDDVPIAVCRQRREPRLSRCRSQTIVGGSAGVNPEAIETPKRLAEARREQLVLYTDFEATGTRT